MFDKKAFAQILKDISSKYENQRDFSLKSEINRTYLSQYINMKLEEPPKPKILKKLSNASYGIASYPYLMKICGYIDIDSNIKKDFPKKITESILSNINYLERIGLTKENIVELQEILIYAISSGNFNNNLNNYLSQFKIETAHELLKFLRDLIKETQSTVSENISLLQSLKEEAVTHINNASSVEEIDSLKNKYEFKSTYYMCPIYGKISAGQPNWAEECIEGRMPIDPDLMNIVNPKECYFLRVDGESMNKIIKNGAYALIRKTDFVEDGDIAVVLVNGFDATLKRFNRQGDFILLEPQSTDISFQTQVYDKQTPIKIIGKYIGKMEINNQ